MYIPAAPWCPRNEPTRRASARHSSPGPARATSPAENYERDWADRFHPGDLNETDGAASASADQGWMFSRSSSRLGCFGSQPSACRVWALDDGLVGREDRAEGPVGLRRHRLDRQARAAGR